MNSEQRVRVQDYVAGAFEAVWRKGQGTYKISTLCTAAEAGKSQLSVRKFLYAAYAEA